MSEAVDIDSAAFLAGLRRALSRIEIKSEADLQRAAIRAQNNARRLCPVDTGRLRASINHVMGKDRIGPFADVGTNVEYAPYVEFGTLHSSAQPFLRPGVAAALTRGIR